MIGSYTEVWSDVLASAERHIADGERSVSRVLRLVESDWRKMDLRPLEGVAFGQKITLPRAAMFGARQTMRARVLAAACSKETTAIVELGCGWGNNLLDLYLSGGPRSAQYLAWSQQKRDGNARHCLAALSPTYR